MDKDTEKICENIKSKKEPDKRCGNNASHGKYCGYHYKNPKPFIIEKKPEKIHTIDDCNKVCKKIAEWINFRYRIRCIMRQGPARFVRSISTNSNDFYSYLPIEDINHKQLFSFLDITDKQIYCCDIRSINSLIYYACLDDKKIVNPYTRNNIDKTVIKKAYAYIDYCKKHKYVYEYETITHPTPEQLFRMKVVDIFNKINDLNYYSSPEWFLDLDITRQKRFYKELYNLWNIHAGLTAVQKNIIVPGYSSKIFKQTIMYINSLSSIEELQKNNLNHIKTLISSAIKTEDRSLGAMYVITALTIVSKDAREAYPWLFESISDNAGMIVHMNNNMILQDILVHLIG